MNVQATKQQQKKEGNVCRLKSRRSSGSHGVLDECTQADSAVQCNLHKAMHEVWNISTPPSSSATHRTTIHTNKLLEYGTSINTDNLRDIAFVNATVTQNTDGAAYSRLLR